MSHHVVLTIYYDRVQELRKHVQSKALGNQEPVIGGLLTSQIKVPWLASEGKKGYKITLYISACLRVFGKCSSALKKRILRKLAYIL